MVTFLLLAVMLMVAFTISSDSRSQLNRMSLAFGVANKPYQPSKPKPKGKGKDKFMHLMARAKYAGTGVVGLSGKINGTVFLSNGVVRVWKKPNNVRNALTQFVRGMFSGTSTAWKTLTPAEVLSWTAQSALYFSKAVFATTYQLKGNAIFQRVNNILASLGLTPVTSCPGIATPTFIPVTEVAAGAQTGQTLTIDITDFNGGTVVPADTYIKVYATSQRNVGQSSFSPSAYRYIGFYPPTTATNPLDIATEYIARFGALVAGQRISLQTEVVSTDGTTTFGKGGRFTTDVVIGA